MNQSDDGNARDGCLFGSVDGRIRRRQVFSKSIHPLWFDLVRAGFYRADGFVQLRNSCGWKDSRWCRYGILSSTAPMYISEASQVSLDAVQEDCMLIDPLDEEQTGCTTKRSRGSARYGTIHHRPWHHRHVLHRKSTWRSTLSSSANH